MIEEIKVSASDRSLIKIIDDANYSGYGRAVTAEIERLQAQLSALQKENAELKDSHQADRVDLLSMINSLRTHIAELERIVKVKDEALKLASEYCNINTGCSQMENKIVCEQIQSALALQPEK